MPLPSLVSILPVLCQIKPNYCRVITEHSGTTSFCNLSATPTIFAYFTYFR